MGVDLITFATGLTCSLIGSWIIGFVLFEINKGFVLFCFSKKSKNTLFYFSFYFLKGVVFLVRLRLNYPH